MNHCVKCVFGIVSCWFLLFLLNCRFVLYKRFVSRNQMSYTVFHIKIPGAVIMNAFNLIQLNNCLFCIALVWIESKIRRVNPNEWTKEFILQKYTNWSTVDGGGFQWNFSATCRHSVVNCIQLPEFIHLEAVISHFKSRRMNCHLTRQRM